jgi:patatin-related protein
MSQPAGSQPAAVRSAPGQSPSGMLEHPECVTVPDEEVRFAVVLNGGVSLAVWMGGVVLELDRLTKATRDGKGAYAVLKKLTGCTARVDVITGTSAGGINGAALALTQVNRDADPALLRDLWIDQGRIETLLRQPFQGQPTSLLKGDEYFLPQLSAALEMLADTSRGWVSPAAAPIDLTITTTVLRGNQAVSIDSMGQQLPQSLHAGRFRWQRRPEDKPEVDPFSERNIKRTAHRLALASRSTASFPVAFEPSFVPVGSPDHKEPSDEDPSEEVRLRPDMADLVESWGTGRRTADRSRYCVDGGALANTPTLSALQAVEAMPASGPVRRVMLLVFPHAPTAGNDPPDSPTEPPTFAGTLTGMLGALTAQGSRSYVESLEQHNLAAAGRRGTRGDILKEVDDPTALKGLTDEIYPQYKRMRRWRAGRDLAARRTGMGADHEIAPADLPPEWSFERVRAAAESAQDDWARNAPPGRAELPYAPQEAPRQDNVVHDGWGWGGISAALGVTEAVSDLLRRLVWVLGPGQDYDVVEPVRRHVIDLAGELRTVRDCIDECWRSQPALTSLAPNASYWALRLACYDHLMLGFVDLDEIERRIRAAARSDTEADAVARALESVLSPDGVPAPARVGREVRRLVDDVVVTLRGTLPILCAKVGELEKRDPDLKYWRKVLAPETNPEKLDARILLARLLQLEIASTTLGDEVSTGSAFPVELVQISAQTENPFARYTRTGDDKLGGASLNRFGGFLKRSWRVNDWMWGRVDGATVLCRTMLDPKRIRRTALLSGYVKDDTTEDEAAGLATATVDGVLSSLELPEGSDPAALRDKAAGELAEVFHTDRVKDGDLPSALPNLAAIFAWALHLESVPAELPALGRAVAADRVDGANPRSRGEVFAEEHHDLLRRLDAPARDRSSVSEADRRRSLEVFDRAGIGWEPLREEAGSDLIIRTAATAAAVMSTVADSDRSGLNAAKPITHALRGAMLLPYWAIWGLTSRQSVARGFSLLALALGGVALALALFGVLSADLQPVAAALGTGAVLAGFAYGALRTGSLLHGIVLLTPLIPLTAYAIDTRKADPEGISTMVIVVVFALGLMILGSIGVAAGSVWGALDRLADRRGLVRPLPSRKRTGTALYAVKVWWRRVAALLWALALTVGIALALALATLLVWWLTDEARIEFVQRHHKWLWVPALAVIAAGGAFAHYGGRWLQVLTRRQSGSPRQDWDYAGVVDPRATSAGWSVVYGIVYLAVAWVVSLESLDSANPLWRRIAFATALVFAVVLLLVLPVVLPLIALREAGLLETRRARAVSVSVEADPVKRRHNYADDLVVRGVSYRRFVTKDDDGAQLTRQGERLEQRVCDARSAAALFTLWNAGRRVSDEDVTRLGEALDVWEREAGALIAAPAQQRLRALRQLLAGPEPDPEQVRHAVDRLVASLMRSRGSTP